MIKLLIMAFLLMASFVVQAGPCDQEFVTLDCLDTFNFDGADGTDGIDGIDGADGIDGLDGLDGTDGVVGTNGINGTNGTNGTNGIDGTNGINGIDGTNGIDGIDGTDGINGRNGVPGMPGLRGLRGRAADDLNGYLAAISAAQVYLPKWQRSRFTFGVSLVGGQQGIGIGYALLLDDHEDTAAFTLSVGVSRGKVAGNASFGFEF